MRIKSVSHISTYLIQDKTFIKSCEPFQNELKLTPILIIDTKIPFLTNS